MQVCGGLVSHAEGFRGLLIIGSVHFRDLLASVVGATGNEDKHVHRNRSSKLTSLAVCGTVVCGSRCQGAHPWERQLGSTPRVSSPPLGKALSYFGFFISMLTVIYLFCV